MSFLLHFSSYLIGGNVPIDDGVDKLNRKYTILILVCLSLPLVTKQFAGDPIECFTPTYFTEPQARYVNSYCWTASTYYIIPVDEEKKQLITRVHSVSFEEGETAQVKGEKIKVNYYQWAPIILLVEAGLFYVPFAIWNATAKNSGIKVGRLLKKVSVISQYTPGHPDRDALIAEFLDQFNTLMGVAKCCPGTVCKFDCNIASCGGAPSSSLFVLYMLIKLLYILNIIVQYFLLTIFLGEGYLFHGVEVLEKLINKKEWWTSPRFPLQTLCQVLAAQQGSLRTYTCQCVLPINLFNEKIFSFVWFFFALLLPVTIYSGLIWVWRTLSCSRIAFVHYYLWRTRRIGKEDLYNNARKMAVEYLGWDGCLVLRLVEMNHGGTILTTLTERLWEFYEGLERAQQDGDPEAFINQRQPLYACGPIQPPGGTSVPSTQGGPYRFYGKHFLPGPAGSYPGYMWNHSDMASPSYSSFPRIRGKIRTEEACDDVTSTSTSCRHIKGNRGRLRRSKKSLTTTTTISSKSPTRTSLSTSSQSSSFTTTQSTTQCIAQPCTLIGTSKEMAPSSSAKKCSVPSSQSNSTNSSVMSNQSSSLSIRIASVSSDTLEQDTIQSCDSFKTYSSSVTAVPSLTDEQFMMQMDEMTLRRNDSNSEDGRGILNEHAQSKLSSKTLTSNEMFPVDKMKETSFKCYVNYDQQCVINVPLKEACHSSTIINDHEDESCALFHDNIVDSEESASSHLICEQPIKSKNAKKRSRLSDITCSPKKKKMKAITQAAKTHLFKDNFETSKLGKTLSVFNEPFNVDSLNEELLEGSKKKRTAGISLKSKCLPISILSLPQDDNLLILTESESSSLSFKSCSLGENTGTKTTQSDSNAEPVTHLTQLTSHLQPQDDNPSQQIRSKNPTIDLCNDSPKQKISHETEKILYFTSKV